jgi:DNA-binding MarR family transcriptional regulator
VRVSWSVEGGSRFVATMIDVVRTEEERRRAKRAAGRPWWASDGKRAESMAAGLEAAQGFCARRIVRGGTSGARYDRGVTDDVTDGELERDVERLGPVLGFMRALWEVDHALESRSKRMKARFGVSGPERLALRIIGELPGISPGRLAAILHVDPSSLTAMLRRLVARRLVSRSRNPEDARSAHLRLTRDGERADELRSGTVESAVKAALDALPPRDVATTVVVLGVLSRLLARDDEPESSTLRARPRPVRPSRRP